MLGTMCLMALPLTATAERLLALSTALTTTREAARVYVHSLGLDSCGLLPGAYPLAGIEATGKLDAIASGRAAVLATRGRWPGVEGRALPPQTWWHVVSTNPFEQRPIHTLPGEPGWREWSGAQQTLPDGDSLLVVLGEGAATNAPLRGKVEIWQYDAVTFARTLRHVHRFAAIPEAAVALTGDPPTAVILAGRGANEAPVLLHMDLEAGTVVETALATTVALPDMAWAPSALTKDNDHLLVLTTGYALGKSQGELVTWVHALDPGTAAPLAAPLRLPGRPAEPALYPIAGGGVWVATQTPGAGFAQVSHVALSPTPVPTLSVLREIPQGGILDHVRVAPDPAAPATRLALALDQRVVMWEASTGIVQQRTFESPVRVLAWDSTALLAAEGPHLHRLEPVSLESQSVVLTPGGWVTGLLPVPADLSPAIDADCDGLQDAAEHAGGTDPANPDTDVDGLMDGLDPRPGRPTPQLFVPAQLTLRGEAAGRALRALPVHVAHGSEATWRVQVAEPAPPWLVLHPRAGRGPGLVYLGVDPAAVRSTEALATAEIRVLLTGETAAGETRGSPAVCSIEVTPTSNDGQRILWVWGANERNETRVSFRDAQDLRGLATLGDLLAASPFLFAHREVSGPFSGALDTYDVVVLTAAAAAQGALTRQAVLDYVAGGGALLFLGSYLGENAPPGLETWLAPLDIQIMANVRVDGRYAGAGDAYLLRHWKDFEIQAGCAIRAAAGHTLTPGGQSGGGAVFVAREYGYGRIALLAGPTPLQSDAVRRPDERRFALDLFRWLGRAGLEVDDVDGDGLPDTLEDRNNNGALDPGETDYLHPDTDSDGIPDGLEDANRNGEVDEGETDPRNPDTDGDALLDGGDPQPYAAFGAPLITSVTAADGSAAEGPAEGGTLIYLKGRNFAVDNVFWIGGQRAPWQTLLDATQVLLRTPESTGTIGGVAVRVVSPSTGLERILPEGFRYTARSTVRFQLSPGAETLLLDGKLRGTLTLRVVEQGGATLGRMAVLLGVDPAAGFAWERIVPGPAVDAAADSWFAKPLDDGGLLLGAPLETAPSPEPPIVAIGHWVISGWSGGQTPPTVTVETIAANTPFGGTLNAELAPVPLFTVEGVSPNP